MLKISTGGRQTSWLFTKRGLRFEGVVRVGLEPGASGLQVQLLRSMNGLKRKLASHFTYSEVLEAPEEDSKSVLSQSVAPFSWKIPPLHHVEKKGS